jgi:hypothetical protein
MHLDPPFLQFPRNDVRRAILLESQFGVSVNVTTNRGEFVLIAASPIERRQFKRRLGLRGVLTGGSGTTIAHGSCHATAARVLLSQAQEEQ